jgi:hypothetical protein
VSARTRWLILLPFARRLVVGTVTAYVAVSFLLGGTRAAKPVFHALTASWAVALGVHRWRSARRARPDSASPPSPSWGTRTGRGFELVVSNLALALVLGELALRCGAAGAGDTLLLGTTLDAHRLAAGHDYGGGLRGNRLGYPGPDFPGEKRPGVYRIAALGDSFAVGPAVPFAANYLTLLEKSLPAAEVLNFGVSGAGPREYLAVLRRDVWAYRPDLVLVSVFVGNDITETLPAPRHLDPRQHALYLLLQRGWRLARERRRTSGVPTVAAADRPPSALSPETFREVEARRLAVCVQPPSQPMEKKWRRALGHLQAIITDCRRQGVDVAVVLIPDEFQVNPRVLAQAVHDAGLKPDQIDLDLPQRRLRDFCGGLGVSCLDLRPAFAAVSDTYAVCDTHWNERGNRLAAGQIAQWLTHGLVGRVQTRGKGAVPALQ